MLYKYSVSFYYGTPSRNIQALINTHKKKITPVRTALDELASAQKKDELFKDTDQKEPKH